MKAFNAGDLVMSAWGTLGSLSNDLGVVMGETKGFDYDNFKQDWTVYDVYWFQAGKTYPVFSHDLNLYKRENNESDS